MATPAVADLHLAPARTRPGLLTVRRLSLALVWLAVATSGIVFTEPAPVDALTIGLIIGLPLVGMISARPVLVALLAAWLIVAAGGFIATPFATDVHVATVFTAVSLYLYFAFFTFAAFVANRPAEHTELIFRAYLFAAVMTAVCGLAGYFNAFPGALDLFTSWGSRARGTFKDPNVYGPFLVPAILYTLHLVLTRPLRRALLPAALCALLLLGVLLSFSRGAWAVTAFCVAAYAALAFLSARANRERVRIVGLAAVGVVAVGAMLVAAASIDSISDAILQRAALAQDYDAGHEGRFDGHHRAAAHVVESPLGIGALEYGERYGADVHNVYLSMFLNTGWLGGAVYVVIVLVTVVAGWRHAMRRDDLQPYFLIAFLPWFGIVVEALIIDTDHWRQFYLLLGVIWGLIAADPARRGPGQ